MLQVREATGAKFRIADGYFSRWLTPMLQEPSDKAAMMNGLSEAMMSGPSATGRQRLVDPSVFQWQRKTGMVAKSPPTPIVTQPVDRSPGGKQAVPSPPPAEPTAEQRTKL